MYNVSKKKNLFLMLEAFINDEVINAFFNYLRNVFYAIYT